MKRQAVMCDQVDNSNQIFVLEKYYSTVYEVTELCTLTIINSYFPKVSTYMEAEISYKINNGKQGSCKLM